MNKFVTTQIKIMRGIRQRRPLSALFYVLKAEVEGDQIRKNQTIKGLNANNVEKKMFQYADDTEIIVTEKESMKQVFFVINNHEAATGAKQMLKIRRPLEREMEI